MPRIEIPSDMPSDLRAQMERLITERKLPLAEAILRAWEKRKARLNTTPSESGPESPNKPPRSEGGHPTLRGTPTPRQSARTASEVAEEALRALDTRAFERQDLLEKARKWVARRGEPLPEILEALRLYMVALALRHGADQHPHREVHVFEPLWAVAAHLVEWGLIEGEAKLESVQRRLQRWLKRASEEPEAPWARELRAWVAWQVWMTQDEDLNPDARSRHAVRGGMVWRVRLDPLYRKPGREMRVLAPYLRVPYRDLPKDRRSGRTQRGILGGVSSLKEEASVKQTSSLTVVILGDPLRTALRQNPPLFNGDTGPVGLQDLLNPAIPPGRHGRRKWVEDMAHLIAYFLGDQKSLAFWMRVLWQAMRALAYGGGTAPLRLVHRAVSMAREAWEEGWVRRPGAFALSKLREFGFFEKVKPFEALAVGAA